MNPFIRRCCLYFLCCKNPTNSSFAQQCFFIDGKRKTTLWSDKFSSSNPLFSKSPTAIKKEKLLQASFSCCYFHPRETKIRRKTKKICQEKKPKRNIFKPCQLKKSKKQEWFCIICSDSYSNSAPREIWLQCHNCKGWAHEACTDAEGSNYICEKCDE